MPTRAVIEALEDRRLLSASATLHPVAHPRIAHDQVGFVRIATAAGPEVTAAAQNFSLSASIQWHLGKTVDAQFANVDLNGDGTVSISAQNPPLGLIPIGRYRTTIVLEDSGTIIATLNETVRITARTGNGLALNAKVGQEFNGPVGFLYSPLASDQSLGINWGDGGSPASLKADKNRFAVLGGHTYTHPGRYTINVAIQTGSIEAVYYKSAIVSTVTVTK